MDWALNQVTYYVMGDTFDPQAPGNVWRTATDWPPPLAKESAFYFQAGGGLAGPGGADRHRHLTARASLLQAEPAYRTPASASSSVTDAAIRTSTLMPPPNWRRPDWPSERLRA